MKWFYAPALLALACLPALPAMANGPTTAEQAPAASLPREARVPGGLAIVPLPAGLPVTAQAFLGEQRVWVLERGDQRLALVGIPLGSQGSITLSLREGNRPLAELAIAVQPKEYEAQRLTIKNPKQVNPGPEELARYRREAAEQQAVYKAFQAQAGDWPRFIKPTAGRYSSPFGLQRFFNGEPRAPHTGLDIAAPEGQAIMAPAEGVVVQTGDYFFNGKTVLIDHGNGLVSMLCHLSRIDVEKGQRLKAGDHVGLVGKTGRATGPHLHWTLSLNDARIDPMLVLP